MRFPWSKTFVEKVEEEFELDRLRKGRTYYDINVRLADPEEFRTRVAEYLSDMGYHIIINEMVKFKELAELEMVFEGGRLKPIKFYIKGEKKLNRGLRFKGLFTVFLILTLLFVFLYVTSKLGIVRGIYERNVLYAALISFFISLILFMIKKIVWLHVWVKLIGIYNISDEITDARVIISGDISEKDERSLSTLRDEMVEFYDRVASKYVTGEKPKIFKEKKKKEEYLAEIMRRLRETENALKDLRIRLAKGEISENTYNKTKKELEEEIEKLKILYELSLTR